ncbi:GDP-L-fucose synthase [Halodesulfovibrio spirochaetisodalis]|uniref:GDP-L-fucose synthase n=1 Tax=Halodesulfovibrio spirochaetisodalis TaxID=1560234 RepID=A0A1B7XIB7_9BACT|nr:GDP-L-fucose synthase [Halodesulfovibrio spirochaetisodalis]OBQ55253.1 GDP-L-fucose synthase [Halodesulfovibrio spirochaetisodalis]
MEKTSKIYVAGHRGLVGGAICRQLEEQGFTNLVVRTSAELDLRDQQQVNAFFEQERPEYVFLAAAKVGGIYANDTYPAEFIRDNLLIQTNVIDAAYKHEAAKLLFLGSSCIYPKFAPQPMTEDCLLTGSLEPTNEWYAIAKIAGIKMCQAYRKQYGFDAISAMPTNLYGQGDNFHPQNSHVLPAILQRFHNAKHEQEESVTVWGTGSPLREFLHVDDMARACIFLMEEYSGHDHVNVGSGKEISILQLAELVAECVGYKGAIVTDPSKPDGTPRKLMDSRKLFDMGWQPELELREGITQTYQWYLDNYVNGTHNRGGKD